MIQQEALDSRRPAQQQQGGADASLRQLDSRLLFGSERELLIQHNGEYYRLRLTRAGKLILTK